MKSQFIRKLRSISLSSCRVYAAKELSQLYLSPSKSLINYVKNCSKIRYKKLTDIKSDSIESASMPQ